MKMLITVSLLLFWCTICFSQKRNAVWCFGHYSAIDFNLQPPNPDSSIAISRGSCASICDSNGGLQFYVAADTVALYASTMNGGKVYNNTHQLMQGGDSLVTLAWYNEQIVIPKPNSQNLYYVFTIGVTNSFGFYYSIVDLSLNGGLGAVIQKNFQLNNAPMTDCLSAIKHGNGRDWWVICRKSSVPNGGSNNVFYKYLITPNGISNVIVQHIGSLNTTNAGNICFSSDGSFLIFSNLRGMVEKFDFNRCNGQISNPITIFPEHFISGSIYINYWGSALSKNDKVLYVSQSNTQSHLFQYDLTAPNIAATEDTIWTQNFPINAAGTLRLAPDNKIYLACAYVPLNAPNYPYADSMYNMDNMNLSVINAPDSLGAACNFQPYSFYLGGKRTYWGLPNNPNYDMPALAGSPCDTLTGLYQTFAGSVKPTIQTTYVTAWQKLFVNAQNIKGKNGVLKIFELNGKEVFSSKGEASTASSIAANGGYYTLDVDCSNFASGLYLVNLQTTLENITTKFLKQ